MDNVRKIASKINNLTDDEFDKWFKEVCPAEHKYGLCLDMEHTCNTCEYNVNKQDFRIRCSILNLRKESN